MEASKLSPAQPQSDDQSALTTSLKLIRFIAQRRGSLEYEENKAKLLSDLMANIKDFSKKKSPYLSNFANKNVVSILRLFLQDKDRSVRINAIKIFRYLTEAPQAFTLLKTKYIIIFLCKFLEREPKPEIFNENLQIFKLMRRWIETEPRTFPKLLANSLVGIAEAADDINKKVVVELLRQLALANPELAAWSGAIRVLIDSIIDPSLRELSESLTYTVLILINDPEKRNIIKPHLDLTRIFCLFTDIDFPVESRDGKKDHLVKFENQIELAKKAIIKILKSWTGLIYLGNEKVSLKSLVMALKQPIKPLIRNAIYEIINEILTIGIKNIPKLSYDFQVQSLINYYLMIVVQIFNECDLFNVLLEITGVEDPEISGPAQKFLKNLSYLNFTLLPQQNHHYPNFLVSSAEIQDSSLVELKSRSYEVVFSMGDYIFDSLLEKKREAGSSRFLNRCENLYFSTPLGMPSFKMNAETISKIRDQLEKDTDDKKFLSLMTSSGVTLSKDWKKWNWSDIALITDIYLNNSQRLGEAIRSKFLKKLLHFYQPSKQAFVTIDWKEENFIYVKIGYNLLRTLLNYREGKNILQVNNEFFSPNKSFITDMANLLNYEVNTQNISNVNKKDVYELYGNLLSYENFGQKMIREYISWIGLLSLHKPGQELLIEFKIYDTLMDLVEKMGRKDHILIQILFSLDYRQEGKSRLFLQYCLENGSKTLVKACLELLRLLYRSELTDFQHWGMDLLVTKLYSIDDINLLALNIIEEVCQDTQYMIAFLNRWPKLEDLGKHGNSFLITLLGVKEGFDYLTKHNNWTEGEMENWKDKLNIEYVERIEKCLFNALDFSSIEEQSNNFRFADLLQSEENSSMFLSFIYRLPWVMTIEFNEFEGAQTVLNLSMEYSPQNCEFILIGVPHQSPELIRKLTISADSNFVIKLSMSIGKVYIDTLCKAIGEPLKIRCDANDKKYMAEYIGNHYHITKNGVRFIFLHTPEDNTIRFTQIKLTLKLDNMSVNSSKMPPHLFGELVKTKKGVELLKKSNYLDSFVADIRNPDYPILKKRASLWCLGHIGRTKRGITLLTQKKLIPEIVRMAEQSEYLSMRGTCLYILNLLATTMEGSLELEKCNWKTKITGGNLKICLPKSLSQFFLIKSTIKDLMKSAWPQQEDYWIKYNEAMQSLALNDEQQEVLKRIIELSSTMTNKTATRDLKQKSKNPDLFSDPHLFLSAMLAITFYKFRSSMRRYIFSLFERFLNNPNVFAILDNVQNSTNFMFNII